MIGSHLIKPPSAGSKSQTERHPIYIDSLEGVHGRAKALTGMTASPEYAALPGRSRKANTGPEPRQQLARNLYLGDSAY